MTPPLCEEHGLTLPCRGCRADELAARGEQATALMRGQSVPRERIRQLLAEHGVPTDARSRAAGEREDT